MSTRCAIGMLNNDGTVSCIYCHNDGYPEGVGKTLKEYYSKKGAVENLIALGDLSSLKPLLEPLGKEHSFNNPEKDVTIAYGRDRWEKGTQAKIVKDEEQFWAFAPDMYDAEYGYLYKDNAWYFAEFGEYIIGEFDDIDDYVQKL